MNKKCLKINFSYEVLPYKEQLALPLQLNSLLQDLYVNEGTCAFAHYFLESVQCLLRTNEKKGGRTITLCI